MAWSSGIHGVTSAALIVASHHPSLSSHSEMDGTMVFGVLSAGMCAACYFQRHKGPVAMLTFAVSLAATGVYGFMEGAWPLGLLETAWAMDAARKGLKAQTPFLHRRHRPGAFVANLESRQSRYREIYGSN
jgi:hypothetical protein